MEEDSCGWSENSPHRFMCFTAWAPAGGPVGKELEGMVLVEEACQKGRLKGFKSLGDLQRILLLKM